MLSWLRNSPLPVWLVLALPAITLLTPIVVQGQIPRNFLVETGEWSVRLMILTLAITPLSLMFKGQGWVLWLLRRRRWFGVASFAYAALHVGFYVWDIRSLGRILFVAERLYAWPGWVAIGLMIPLALTSNSWSQRALAVNWKRLQRLTYIAALLTALHWLLLTRGPSAWVQIGLIAGLEIIRIGYRVGQWRRLSQQAAR